MNSNKELTILYEDFDPSRLIINPVEETKTSKGQKLGYINYNHPTLGVIKLLLQLPWIHMNYYGIPSIGDYYKEDAARMFVKTPLDENNKEILEFTSKIKELDLICKSDDFKTRILKKNINKYSYHDSYQVPVMKDDDDDDDKNKNKKKVPYIKLKINTKYPEGYINTVVFL